MRIIEILQHVTLGVHSGARCPLFPLHRLADDARTTSPVRLLSCLGHPEIICVAEIIINYLFKAGLFFDPHFNIPVTQCLGEDTYEHEGQRRQRRCDNPAKGNSGVCAQHEEQGVGSASPFPEAMEPAPAATVSPPSVPPPPAAAPSPPLPSTTAMDTVPTGENDRNIRLLHFYLP